MARFNIKPAGQVGGRPTAKRGFQFRRPPSGRGAVLAGGTGNERDRFLSNPMFATQTRNQLGVQGGTATPGRRPTQNLGTAGLSGASLRNQLASTPMNRPLTAGEQHRQGIIDRALQFNASRGGVNATGGGQFGPGSPPGTLGPGGLNNVNDIMGLINTQLGLNQGSAQETLNRFDSANMRLQGVLPGLVGDPLFQGARGTAAGLLGSQVFSPEQQAQQQNQLLNIFGAREQAQLAQAQGEGLGAGQLGGSAEQAARSQIQRGTGAAISDAITRQNLERAQIERGARERALGLAQGLAGEQANLGLATAQIELANIPQFEPTDLSAFGELLAKRQNLGQPQQFGGAVGGFPNQPATISATAPQQPVDTSELDRLKTLLGSTNITRFGKNPTRSPLERPLFGTFANPTGITRPISFRGGEGQASARPAFINPARTEQQLDDQRNRADAILDRILGKNRKR